MTTFQQPPTSSDYPEALSIFEIGSVDLCLVSDAVIYDVSSVDILTVQIDRTGFSWATSAIVTLQVSNNGRDWYALPSGAVTFSAASISARIDVGGYRFARFIVTTVGSGSSPYPHYIALFGRSRPVVGTI